MRNFHFSFFLSFIALLVSGSAFSQAEVPNPNTAAGIYWKTKGNTGTVDGTHFIGTTDAVPLNFRINNVMAGRIDSARYNVLWGYKVGVGLSSGQQLVGLGHEALRYNTTGSQNVAVGYQSMYANMLGGSNTAVGYKALYTNFSSTLNTALGTESLYSNNGGTGNTGLGAGSLYFNVIGNQNTASGYNSLGNTNTGSFNTAMGANAFAGNTTGSYNTAMGYLTSLGSGTLNNASAFGAYARVDASHQMVLGAVAGINGATQTTQVNIGQTSTATNARRKPTNAFSASSPAASSCSIAAPSSRWNNPAKASAWALICPKCWCPCAKNR